MKWPHTRLKDLFLPYIIKYSNRKRDMLMHIKEVKVQRWKAVVCANPVPLLTHDSHCTHKNTPQMFHTNSWTTQQLHRGMGTLLSVCLSAHVCCVHKPCCLLHNQTQISSTLYDSQTTDSLVLVNRCSMAHAYKQRWRSKCYIGQSVLIPEMFMSQLQFILFSGQVLNPLASHHLKSLKL